MVGIDFYTSRNLEDLVFRFELAYKRINYQAEGNDFGSSVRLKYYLEGYSITPELSLLYNFLRKEHLKIYGGAFINCNISSYSRNELERIFSESSSFSIKEYAQLDKSWVSGGVKAGTLINNKYEIGASATLFGTISQSPSYSISPRSYGFFLAYHLK